MTSGLPAPLLPELLVAEVLANYDLAPPIECTRISTGCNDIYRVCSGGGRSVLKLYRAGWRTRSEVMDEIAVLLHLGRKASPVALPLARRDGTYVQTVAVGSEQREAVLFGFAEGKTAAAADEARCRLLGRVLADLHSATDDFDGRCVRYDLEQLLDRPLRALEPLLDDRPEDREYLRGLAARLRDRIAGLPSGALEWGFCHGDFRPANVHWSGATGITVFDWEMGGLGFRAYDLALFRFYLSGVGDLAAQERLWAAYLSGYAEGRPLRASEREAVPLLVPLRPIRILGNILQTVRKNWNLDAWEPARAGPLPNPAFFDEALRFLREWEARSRV